MVSVGSEGTPARHLPGMGGNKASLPLFISIFIPARFECLFLFFFNEWIPIPMSRHSFKEYITMYICIFFVVVALLVTVTEREKQKKSGTIECDSEFLL